FNHSPLGIDEDVEDCLFDSYEILTPQIKNHKYMPELEQPWAYPAVICMMALIVIGSIVYAKKQRWL
ncbi:MAG: hypothetical protein ACYTXY_44890, partial [Nostoc sp.]